MTKKKPGKFDPPISNTRKRGRPRKEPQPIGAAHGALPKRKPGRPKKEVNPFEYLSGRPITHIPFPSDTDGLKFSDGKTKPFSGGPAEWIEFTTNLKPGSIIHVPGGFPPLPQTPPTRTLANGVEDPYPEYISPSPGINSVAIIHWQSTGKSLGLSSLVTAGFLIRKSPDTLTIARTIRRGKYIKKAVFTIPMSLVTKIEKLTEPNLIQIP